MKKNVKYSRIHDVVGERPGDLDIWKSSHPASQSFTRNKRTSGDKLTRNCDGKFNSDRL